MKRGLPGLSIICGAFPNLLYSTICIGLPCDSVNLQLLALISNRLTSHDHFFAFYTPNELQHTSLVINPGLMPLSRTLIKKVVARSTNNTACRNPILLKPATVLHQGYGVSAHFFSCRIIYIPLTQPKIKRAIHSICTTGC